MRFFRPTAQDLESFDQDGYLVVRNLLTPEETELFQRITRIDAELLRSAHASEDAQSRDSRLALRNHLIEGDLYSSIARSQRLVQSVQAMLGDEVYHWHHKMMMKDAKVGGAWEWHQDYGYWYQFNNCLWPDLASCMIAVDRATRENGCLQVLRGSHRLGRIDHVKVGSQTGADPKRVEAAKQQLEHIYCDLAPGDGLFFHANTLHCSDANTSEHPRWTLICCYNTKHNSPFEWTGGHPEYAPLDILPDEQILPIAQKQLASIEAKV